MKNDKKEFSFEVLDKTPISKLLILPAEDLFEIQEKANLEFEKVNYRKKWIDGIIDLKYKSTINELYKKAELYFNSEASPDMDKYNKDILVHYIQDDTNKDNLIQVEFFRGSSDIPEKPKVQKRFRLVKDLKTIYRLKETAGEEIIKDKIVKDERVKEKTEDKTKTNIDAKIGDSHD